MVFNPYAGKVMSMGASMGFNGGLLATMASNVAETAEMERRRRSRRACKRGRTSSGTCRKRRRR